jgi:DNA-binding transcriptional LysR family regulator
MRLTLRQLHIFIAVAERGSTTAAGEALALSQSATSAALSELEASLQSQLFDRVGKRLLLNDSGRALLPEARLLLDGAQAVEQRFGAGNAAAGFRLRIGASTTVGNYVMPPIIASFLRERPTGHLNLAIGNTQEIGAAVAAFEVDVGFIEGPCHEQQTRVVPWMEDELVVVCSPRHPLRRRLRGARTGIAALREASWLLREPGSGTREAVEQALLPHLHHLESSVELGSAEAIKLAAAEGVGLACLSRRVVEDFVALGRLAILPTTLPALRRSFSLVHHERKHRSPAMERFIAHCLSYRTAAIAH